MNKTTEQYWTERYEKMETGWDIGYPSTPLKAYFDQLEDKGLKILIPGAGNAHEAMYLWKQGFKNVYILDISSIPISIFLKNNPDFPINQAIHADFFEHIGTYDLIIEQTFFCSFEPTEENRKNYASKMHELLSEGGKLVGLWFDFPLSEDMMKRPFGGSREEYLEYFKPLFSSIYLDRAYNSIKPRAGSELFGIFKK